MWVSTEDVPTPLKVWVRGYENAQLGTGDEEKRAKTKKDSEHHELMVQAFPGSLTWTRSEGTTLGRNVQGQGAVLMQSPNWNCPNQMKRLCCARWTT